MSPLLQPLKKVNTLTTGNLCIQAECIPGVYLIFLSLFSFIFYHVLLFILPTLPNKTVSMYLLYNLTENSSLNVFMIVRASAHFINFKRKRSYGSCTQKYLHKKNEKCKNKQIDKKREKTYTLSSPDSYVGQDKWTNSFLKAFTVPIDPTLQSSVSATRRWINPLVPC